MGKGDKKTRRGKIRIGSYGVRRRPKKTTKKAIPIKMPEVVAEAVIEEKPIVKIAEVEVTVPVEKAEEKAPKKAAPKKATAKKTAAKPVKEEAKPKASKSKKKAAVIPEEKSSPKKESTEP